MRQAVIEACERQPRIQYLGQVREETVHQLLLGSIAAVVPSVCYENQPYAVLEAFAAGRPVVGTGHGSLPDLISNGQHGLTFEAGDPDDLARAVIHLAGDPKAAIAMGAAGRLLVETRFSPQAHYERLMALYDRARSRGVTDAA
jgi:glycosyltransferase involved in cell wall biosynthesis